MLTLRVNKKLMEACIDKYQIFSTILEDSTSLDNEKCDACKNQMVAMRLDKSPNTGNGFMPPSDRCLFYGCIDCNTFVYDEDELNNYADKRTNLSDFLSDQLNIG